MTQVSTGPAPLIAIVGVCASGKSTLAGALRGRGYNARQVLQEHSYVPYMWRRITNPDLLIYLDCTLETTRRRRNSDFPSWLADLERQRLLHAREHCDIYIDTEGLTPSDVVERALAALAGIPLPGPAPHES